MVNINNSKNLNIDLMKSKNDVRDIAPRRSFYINIFCPRCGKFNVHRHQIFKHRYLCDDCGHRWKR